MILGKHIPPVLAKKPVNLAEWLDIATRHIVPSAQARVRAEIEAHYGEAVQASIKRGLPEFDAHATALADLGNASTAGARFCLEHPSTLDAKIVGLLAWLQICFGLLLASELTAFHFLPNSNAEVPPLAVLLILIFFLVICPAVTISVAVLVWRSRQLVTPRMISMLLGISCFNLSAYILKVYFYPFDNSSDHVPQILHLIHADHLYQLLHLGFVFQLLEASPFIWLTVFDVFLLLRLRKKLATACEDTLPPPTSATHA